MRKKRKDTGGFTLVEMLCAVAILILLCLMLSAGLSMAVKTYREITAASETQLLLNTLVDAIADELRYAHQAEAGDGAPSYNGGWKLTLKNGRVQINGEELLPSGTGKTEESDSHGRGGAYHGGAYRVDTMNIQYDQTGNWFTVELAVAWKDGKIRAKTPEGGVVIRCLNPPGDTSEEEEGTS